MFSKLLKLQKIIDKCEEKAKKNRVHKDFYLGYAADLKKDIDELVKNYRLMDYLRD